MPLTSSCKRAIVPTALALLALPTVMPTNAAETPGGGSIELRGLHRARYERLSPQYRAGLGGSDTVLALQTSLVLEANWPKLSFMGELLDARAELNDSDSVFAGVVNTLEPIQNIDTWSMRVFRPVERSRINYEIEAGIQRGDSAAGQSNPLVWLEHDAYYAHAEIGYAPDLAWTPNILLQYDVASGDRDPTDNKNERFNPLGPAARGIGHLERIGRPAHDRSGPRAHAHGAIRQADCRCSLPRVPGLLLRGLSRQLLRLVTLGYQGRATLAAPPPLPIRHRQEGYA